jgi:protein lifeguard
MYAIPYQVELLITFSFCLASQYSEAYRNFQLDNIAPLIIAVVLMIVVMVVAACVKKARRFPIDMVLLLFFILSFSYLMSFCCSAVVQSSDEPVVPLAIGATIAVALGLTAYAFFCKGNWALWIGLLVVCGSIGFVIGISLIFVRLEGLVILFCVIGLLIYGIYLVILTKMIIGKEIEGFPMDAPIIASLFLYIYIMRIFMYLLVIFGGRR